MTRDVLRAERITMLTDFLLAGVAVGLALPLLLGAVGGGSPQARAWGSTFLFTALAALAGGVFHGFRHRLAGRPLAALWRATLLLSAPVGFFLLVAAAYGIAAPLPRAGLLVFAVGKLVAVLVALLRSARFAWVAYDSGVSLIVLGLAVGGRVVAEGGSPGSGWILAGVVLSLAGAWVQQRGWRRDRHFDHNDVFHLVQAVACLLFFRGAGQG